MSSSVWHAVYATTAASPQGGVSTISVSVSAQREKLTYTGGKFPAGNSTVSTWSRPASELSARSRLPGVVESEAVFSWGMARLNSARARPMCRSSWESAQR